jgi:hypothetical protein
MAGEHIMYSIHTTTLEIKKQINIINGNEIIERKHTVQFLGACVDSKLE